MKKKLFLTVCIILSAIMLFSCSVAMETADKPKTITVQVFDNNGESTEEQYETTKNTLGEALLELGVISGEESNFGLYVTTVNGITADESKQEWWMVCKNGQSLPVGVDSQPIANGEHYEFVFTVGW